MRRESPIAVLVCRSTAGPMSRSENIRAPSLRRSGWQGFDRCRRIGNRRLGASRAEGIRHSESRTILGVFGNWLARLSRPPSPRLPPLPRLRRTGRRAGPGLTPRGSEMPESLESAVKPIRPCFPRPPGAELDSSIQKLCLPVPQGGSGNASGADFLEQL